MCEIKSNSMATKLHLGDESKIQVPDLFAGVTLDTDSSSQLGLTTSTPVIGEDYREVRLGAITQRSPIQSRAPFDPEHNDEDQALVVSLETEGQKQPITLATIEGSQPTEYWLLDGHRRVDALLSLKRETTKAIITRPGTLEADLVTMTANVRKNLTPIEMAQTVARLKERHGLTLDQIARKTGISRRRLTEMASFARADSVLQSEGEQGRLTAEVAFTLCQAPLQHQAQLAKIASAANLKGPVAKRLVERITTTGESPDTAALSMGLKVETDDGPKEQREQLVTPTSVSPSSPVPAADRLNRNHSQARAMTTESAAALVTDLFSELDLESATMLVETASQHSTPLEVLKLTGLLMLAGQSLQEAIKTASAESGTSLVRKILKIFDAVTDMRLQRSPLSSSQRLMLAGVALKIDSLHKQNVEEEHR